MAAFPSLGQAAILFSEMSIRWIGACDVSVTDIYGRTLFKSSGAGKVVAKMHMPIGIHILTVDGISRKILVRSSRTSLVASPYNKKTK